MGGAESDLGSRLVLITGANMSVKSTLIRQVALITIMAQVVGLYIALFFL